MKIVDKSGQHGRLLAVADQVSPKDSGDANADRVTLLHVEFEEIGDAVWRLDPLDEVDFPVLVVNREIDMIRDIARRDDHFFSLVYAAVVEQILHYIVLAEQYEDIDAQAPEWIRLWMTYATRLAGPIPSDASDADRRKWVDSAVEAFCAHQHVRARFERARTKGAS